MVTFSINGKEISAEPGRTILSVAREYGVQIPTLCHDERIKPQGACGLCVVEIEGTRRLLRACGTAASNGMAIHTHSPRVNAARKSILEFLLSAHTGDCRPPCMLECPANSDCQAYVKHISEGRYKAAASVMKDAFPIPASVGRICPHPCEKACRRRLADEPINIAGLKYFGADMDLKSGEAYIPECLPDTGKTVAVVGGGPAGLTAAYFLRREGHGVALYEKMPLMGGLLRYGIPEYRLPKSVLDAELAVLEKTGIVFKNNAALGKDIQLEELREKYDAVIIATGAGLSKKFNCPGENLPGVLGGIDFLMENAAETKRSNENGFAGRRVAVVGGSNTAMDAARTAVRLGAEEVCVIYRRSREEMPAEPEEIKEAEEEGVVFKFLTNPIEITGDGRAERIRLQKMTLGEPDASGRRSPVPMEGQEEIVEADTVIMAIGQDVNLSGLEGLKATRRGALEADKNFMTDLPGVAAIGDVTGKSAYAIEAIGHAKKAAAAIHVYITGDAEVKPWAALPKSLVTDEKTAGDFKDEKKLPRENIGNIPVSAAKHCFKEIKTGFTQEQAEREAKRCLSCGCADYHECKLIKYANEYGANPLAFGGAYFHKPKPRPEFHGEIFKRNPQKCILCGLCARICEQETGLGVFSTAGRGFDAMVTTAYDLPMPETECADCGKCVERCPTGALMRI